MHTQNNVPVGWFFVVLLRPHGYQVAGVCFARKVDDLFGFSQLNHLAVAQHHNTICDLRHYGKVVRDVQGRDMSLADGILDSCQNIHLGGNVKGRGRLVKHDEIGLGTQGHGRHGALQLPPRDLVRVLAAKVLGIRQAQSRKQCPGALLCLLAG